ncbi:hypothetical protein V6N11_022420 [Hibiscus sabdariffa]|uniref:Transposase MuDR plant domain-containing protein n=1 Tax=Hibiscus sabdariffa TaxID=183260 RepID=A0ABR2TJ47_9ROSI
MDASSGNDENGSNGSDASASNGPDSVHFGWNNDMADEESYDAQEDSGESDWLGREHLLSDDDEELNAIGTHFRVVKKKIRNKTVQAADLEPPFILGSVVENEIQDTNEEAGNEANRADENVLNENEAGGIGDNEANGADEREIQGNEASLVGLSTGEETDYLGSSDVGSYETDSDGDFVSRKTTKVFFDSSTSEPRFELGMIFENGNQFKDALYAYAVAHRFDFKFVCNRKEKVRVVCKGKGCPFVVHASWDKSDSCFKVKTLVTDHSCSVTFKNKRANYKFVGKHFISKIRIVPQLRLLDMMRLGREELNVELNKQLCSRAKKWAEEKIKGNISHEFNKLFDYVLALRIADPDGSFDLVVERPTATDIPKFRRFYVHNHADQPPPMPTSTGPSSPSHSIGPSAPQPSNTPSSPPHSNGPAAPPMVFMPTPSVQSSFAFDSPPVQPLVTKKIVFSPKRKVTANRIPMYRKSREHVTPSTTDMSHVSSQPAATVSVPKEAIPSKLTIWKH